MQHCLRKQGITWKIFYKNIFIYDSCESVRIRCTLHPILPSIETDSFFFTQTLSRVHAVLEAKDGNHFLIHDQGSSNKSWRNAFQLEPQVRYACQHLDQLTFGEVKMRLTVKEQADEASEEEEEPFMAATQAMSTGKYSYFIETHVPQCDHVRLSFQRTYPKTTQRAKILWFRKLPWPRGGSNLPLRPNLAHLPLPSTEKQRQSPSLLIPALETEV